MWHYRSLDYKYPNQIALFMSPVVVITLPHLLKFIFTLFRPILAPWPNLTLSQNGPRRTWSRPNLTPFGLVWLYCFHSRFQLQQAILTLGPFWPYHLFLSCRSLLVRIYHGINNSSPSWSLAHFDSWPILTLPLVSFLLFAVSSTLSGQ